MKKSIVSIIAFAALTGLIVGCTTTTVKPALGGSQTIYATPATSSGTNSACSCKYVGFVLYSKTVSQGWGWAPDTNNYSVFTAADGGGRTDTKIYYAGKMTPDAGCGQTTVTISNPPASTAYRFMIYFPTNVPTTNYPIILTGFQQ